MADPDMAGDKMLKQISQAVWNSHPPPPILKLMAMAAKSRTLVLRRGTADRHFSTARHGFNGIIAITLQSKNA